jgi:hypothetical protein
MALLVVQTLTFAASQCEAITAQLHFCHCGARKQQNLLLHALFNCVGYGTKHRYFVPVENKELGSIRIFFLHFRYCNIVQNLEDSKYLTQVSF